MKDKRITRQAAGTAADESVQQILISVFHEMNMTGKKFRHRRTSPRGRKRGFVRFLAVFLAALLLCTDTVPAYASENGQSGELFAGNAQEESMEAEEDSVSGGDAVVSGGEDGIVSSGDHAVSDGDADTSQGEGPVSGGDADTSQGDGLVSGGDAVVSGGDAIVSGGDMLSEEPLAVREPEQFYREPEPENYGTLTDYDAYSRTYHVERNRYVTVIGNDGATYIDEDGVLRRTDNTLEEAGVSLFGMLHTGTTYANRANDYTVLFPEDMSPIGQAASGNEERGSGIAIASGEYMLTLYPAEGSFAGGVARGNAIRYSNVFPGMDYQ